MYVADTVFIGVMLIVTGVLIKVVLGGVTHEQGSDSSGRARIG